LLLNILRKEALNVNELAARLAMPQSSVATHINILEEAGLVVSEKLKAKKGNQKLCRTAFSELLVKFPEEKNITEGSIDVEMPIGIFTACDVKPPCGLCSAESIIGFLDTPDSFLNPDRMKAGLLWCGAGFVEYQFPNNAIYESRAIQKLAFRHHADRPCHPKPSFHPRQNRRQKRCPLSIPRSPYHCASAVIFPSFVPTCVSAVTVT
jgi:predicted transcriptional regulator